MKIYYVLLASLAALSGCNSLPTTMPTAGTPPANPAYPTNPANTPISSISSVPSGSHKFQCHPVSPGACAYAVFNEGGTVRETFILAPGEARIVANILPRTTFCMAVEKPLDPSKCQRLGLDGKPLQK